MAVRVSLWGQEKTVGSVAGLKRPSTHQLVVLNSGTNTPWKRFKGAGERCSGAGRSEGKGVALNGTQE